MRLLKLAFMVLFASMSLAGCAKGVCVSPQCVAQAKYIVTAETGTAEDKFNLGYTYYVGSKLFEKNASEAAKWYEKAATLGSSKAQYNLGTMYDAGEGVAQDKTRAFYWFKQAAEQGDTDSQYNLGYKYDRGDGVEKNKALSIEWYTKAANQGDGKAAYNLGVLYSEDESPSMVLLNKWFDKAAENDVDLQFRVAVIYHEGIFKVEKNYSKAFELFHKAAMRGNLDAQNQVASAYLLGEGVSVSLSDAYAWLSLAKNQKLGVSEAQVALDELITTMTPKQIETGKQKLAALSQQIKPE